MFTDADEAYYQRIIGVLEFTKDEDLTKYRNIAQMHFM